VIGMTLLKSTCGSENLSDRNIQKSKLAGGCFTVSAVY
jgi:hypothetical protein